MSDAPSPEYKRAEDLVAKWLGPDGDAYIDHLGSPRCRDLINAIADELRKRK